MPTLKTRRKPRQRLPYLARLYDGTPTSLFVPAERMWAVHNAATPQSICRRNGIPVERWYDWLRDHGELIRGWLYHRAGSQFTGQATDQMLVFRKASEIKSLITAVNADASTTWKLDPGLVNFWLRKNRHFEWFRVWLIEGQKPPAEIRVANENEIGRMHNACHRAELLESVPSKGNGKKYDQYLRWFARLPHANPVEEFEFLFWQFGGATPAGWTVIPAKAIALRDETSPVAICAAAGINAETFRRWRRDPSLWAALQDAIARPGLEPIGPAWRRLFDRTDPKCNLARALPMKTIEEVRQRLTAGEKQIEIAAALEIGQSAVSTIKLNDPKLLRLPSSVAKTRKAMLAYAKAATLQARLKRSGLNSGSWANLLASAKDCGCKPALLAYVNHTLDATKWRLIHQRGCIAPHLYLPYDNQIKFRDSARKRMSENNLAGLKSELPQFDRWFVDWTTPRECQGRRARERATRSNVIKSADSEQQPKVRTGNYERDMWAYNERKKSPPTPWDTIRIRSNRPGWEPFAHAQHAMARVKALIKREGLQPLPEGKRGRPPA